MLSGGSGLHPGTDTQPNVPDSTTAAVRQGSSGSSFSSYPTSSAGTNVFSVPPGPMPVPLMPYPPQLQTMPAPPGSQGQLVCNGCRTLLVYPQGAGNVCCALCNSVTTVPPQGAEMAQLICGGCRTLLMYIRGATSVQCSCCHTVNLAMEASQVAHGNCGGCGTMLMYPYGAQSVKCAVCQFVTAIGVANARMPFPTQRPTYVPPPQPPPSGQIRLA